MKTQEEKESLIADKAIEYASSKGNINPEAYTDKQVGLLHGFIDGYVLADKENSETITLLENRLKGFKLHYCVDEIKLEIKELIEENNKLKTDNKWININDRKPISFERGNWDGLRSDYFIGKDIREECHIVRIYEGTIDGHYFCDFISNNDFELFDIVSWKLIN